MNGKKSCLITTQTTAFIGLTLNSCLMSAFLSQESVTNILQLLAHFRPDVSLQYKVVLRLIGMLTMIPLGLHHLRQLQLWNNSLWLDPTRHCHRLMEGQHGIGGVFVGAGHRSRPQDIQPAGTMCSVLGSKVFHASPGRLPCSRSV